MERAPLPTYCNLLTLQGHECVHGLKLIVERDGSIEFFTASDKCLPCALHELLAVILALIIFWEAFQPGLSALVSFQFCLLNSSVHFQLKLHFFLSIFISITVEFRSL